MSGLTVEEVDKMQDEMNKIGEDESADAKAAEEAAKLAEAKAAEDAAKAKADADAAAKAKEEADGKAKGDEEIDVVRELREQVRASNDALRKITGDYQRLHKVMLDKGLITDEEVEASKAQEAAAQAAFAERQAKLGEMLAVMELNPTYSDVRQVCTQSNFDDIIDGFARFYVKENGGNLQEVAARIEMEVWAEPNPYKKMYEIIKKHHPKFAVADDAKAKEKEAEEAAKKIAADADKAKDKKVVDANPSAAAIGAGGGGTGGGGWTAEKIDKLDEDELQKVPKDIYEKYLMGQL